MSKKVKNKEAGMEKERKFLRHPILVLTTVSAIIIATVSIIFFYFQIEQYERGILDVCADQQDTYVKLVVDQINLKQNRNDEEIIQNILGTLDSSSNKYWTFSKEQSMLYVKDVLETNKYQGITAASYYDTESARVFLEGLQLNQVSHAEVLINDKKYIASGVTFEYNQNNYRLCLLTNRSVLLDNNRYLGNRTQMWIFVASLVVIILLVPMIYAHYIRNLQIKSDGQQKELKELNTSLTKINQRLSEQDLHDTRNNLWKQKAFKVFMEKLKKRNILPLTIVHVHCNDVESRNHFLKMAQYSLNKEVLRFEYQVSDLLLIFVGIEEKAAMMNMMPFTSEEVYLSKGYVVNHTSEMNIDLIYTELGLCEEE